MFVLFISFILILSVGRTKETKHMPLKLAESLTHIKDMLTDIESKIEHDRKLLSQISGNLNMPDANRPVNIGRMDYDEMVDIWDKSLHPTWPAGVQSNATQPAVNSTFVSNQPTSTSGNLTTKSNVTESPFIHDMKTNMVADGHDYFTAFLTRFMELIAIKDPAQIMPVVFSMNRKVLEIINDGVFDNAVDDRLLLKAKNVIEMVENMTLPEIKGNASAAFFILKNKASMLNPESMFLINFYANIMNTDEGEQLFRALETFYDFPKDHITPTQVSEQIVYAVLEPYMRTKDLPSLGAQRRSMDLNDVYKHSLHPQKRPKLLQKMIQQFKHGENNERHSFFKSNKQKTNKNYRKNLDEHLNERNKTRRRAYVPSLEDYDQYKHFQNSIEDKIYKIREVSSYSDEADQLKNNLHDALRHGNTTFEVFRKSGGDINDKQTDKTLSTETDVEWVIKNNIYKVFEQQEVTGNKNVSLKDTLARSLTKVRQMLTDIEFKIEKERKILKNIDHRLKHKGGQVYLDDKLDYHDPEIMWKYKNETIRPKGATIGVGIQQDVITLETTASIMPKPPATTTIYPTQPDWNQPEENALTKAFVSDMTSTMQEDRHGYFTAFLTRFTEIVYRRNVFLTYAVMEELVKTARKYIEAGKYNAMDDIIMNGAETIFSWFDQMLPDQITQQAGVLHFLLKVKYSGQALLKEYNDFLDFYDEMFTKEEGTALFESLIPLHFYPYENYNYTDIAEGILETAFVPYFRVEGRRQQRKLIQHIMIVMDNILDKRPDDDTSPELRAKEMSLIENRTTHAHLSTKGQNQQPVLDGRRSMNYKRFVKHLLVKHPKLFKKIKRQCKHEKKDKHHHFKRKSHPNYRGKCGRYKRRRHSHEHSHKKRKAVTKGNEPKHRKHKRDSIKTKPYHRARVRRTQKRKFDQLKERVSTLRQLKRPTETTSTIKLHQDDVQYMQFGLRKIATREKDRQ